MKSGAPFLRLCHLALAAFVMLFAPIAIAQVSPAAFAGSGGLSVFLMYKDTNPDLIITTDHGITYGGEFKFRPIAHVQPAIMGRGENDFTSKYIRWSIYSGGPQFHFMASHRLSPYAGIMLGLGPATFRGGYKDTATIYQIGGGATYRIIGRLSAIADFQYHWADFGTHKGIDTTFTPYSINVGVQYKIF